MGYRTRIYYTDSDKALMWDRWQAGDSLREIAQLFNRQGKADVRAYIEWMRDNREIFEFVDGVGHYGSGWRLDNKRH